jgi:hypothetical protein
MTTKYNPEISIIKANLTKAITDKINPEMITYLRPEEIERIALIEAFIQEQAKFTQNMPEIPDNIYDDFIYNFKLSRCSVNGFRSEQLVQILNTKMGEIEKKNNNEGA